MLLIDASTSLLQIGQTFNGDSSKGVGKRTFSMRIADQIKRQWVAIFDENHRPDSMRFGGHFSREYALAPAIITCGRSLRAVSRTSFISMQPVSRLTP